MTLLLRRREVRAVLVKHRKGLRAEYARWAAAGGLGEVSDGLGIDSMSMEELMLALKLGRLLEQRPVVLDPSLLEEEERAQARPFTTRDAIRFYLIATRGSDSRRDLSYEQFVEVACRICHLKLLGTETGVVTAAVESANGAGGADVTSDAEVVKFAQRLDTWLGLHFLPALRNASSKAVSQRFTRGNSTHARSGGSNDPDVGKARRRVMNAQLAAIKVTPIAGASLREQASSTSGPLTTARRFA